MKRLFLKIFNSTPRNPVGRWIVNDDYKKVFIRVDFANTDCHSGYGWKRDTASRKNVLKK